MRTLRPWLEHHPLAAPYRWLRDLWRLSHTRREVAQLRQLADRAHGEHAALEQRLAAQARLIGELQHQASQARAELAWAAPLYRHVELPFSHAEPAPDWIANAERVLGIRLADLPPGERERWFYSVYSEMAGGLGHLLEQQYQAYLPYLPIIDRHRVLDVGCGAGEFLHFLKRHGREALGIDLEAQEVERARARGLEAQQAEALAFLQGTEERFAAISLLQVIEHVPAAQVRPLVAACAAALAPGGVLLLETVNLRHPNALNGFYTDPTHQAPLSDSYLSLLARWNGLENVQLVYTLPEWLPGVSQQDRPRCYANYTVVGYRSR